MSSESLCVKVSLFSTNHLEKMRPKSGQPDFSELCAHIFLLRPYESYTRPDLILMLPCYDILSKLLIYEYEYVTAARLNIDVKNMSILVPVGQSGSFVLNNF